MTSRRKSFVIHIDSLDILDDLTDEQAGKLFKAIKANQLGHEIELDCITKIAFSPFRNQFIRDNDKYEKLCEKNRLIAVNRHSTKSTTGTNGNDSSPTVTKSTDNDSKNKSDSKSDSNNKEQDNNAPKVAVDFSLIKMGDEELTELKRIRRKNKGGAITQRVANALAKEFDLARSNGLSNDDILTEWEVRGWKSFKAEWVKSTFSKPNKHDLSNTTYTSGKF